MKAYGMVNAYIHVFLTPVLVGEWSGPGPGRFTPVESCSYVSLINYYAMKSYGGVDVYIHVFLITVYVGEWSA
jgi:hypothetical protein